MIELAYGGQSHGCHADVMEGCYAAAHDEAADYRVTETHSLSTDQHQREGRARDSSQKRKQNGWPVIADRDR